jgi:hypothetical protein
MFLASPPTTPGRAVQRELDPKAAQKKEEILFANGDES